MKTDIGTASFAVYIPVGPSQEELDRAADVLASVIENDSNCRWAVLVYDSDTLCDVRRRISLPGSCELIIIRNPRAGFGHSTTGGLCVAGLVAMECVQSHTDAAFLLKLDTDSLVIAPFYARVMNALSTYPDAGLLGVLGDSFGENRTYTLFALNRGRFESARRLGTTSANLGVRELAELRLWGVSSEQTFADFLKARALLEIAIAHGYVPGEYCQGGGYVVSRRLLDLIAETRRFSDPLSWRDLIIGEDVMMALQCGAVGLKMYDLSGKDQIFAIAPVCLQYSRLELIELNCSIVHSIKGRMEDDFRAFFRARRGRRIGALE